jgi:predicted ATP-grasp superfamily ATP-dependent carboligase
VSRVLITGARAPVALHLSRLFHAAGHQVTLADSHRFPLSRATRTADYQRLPPPRGNMEAYATAVERVVEESRIDLVIPTCEEVFFLASARDLHRRAMPLFAPPFDVLALAHNKASFAAAAAGFGADAPRTDLVSSVGELASIADAGQRVLKPAWSRFASRVLIQPSSEQLATVMPTPDDPWVAQDYLPGDELCSYGIAVAGELVGFAAYRPLYRSGLGAGVAFEPTDEPAAEALARGFARSTNWTGQLSFDFRRDAGGTLHVIECNPRAVSGLHFFSSTDGLPAAILEGRPSVATDKRAMTVPLALLVYGLPNAVRTGTVQQWWADFRRMGNVLASPGDRPVGLAQLLALGEIGLRALGEGKTLQQAATHDIEWNGEPLR